MAKSTVAARPTLALLAFYLAEVVFAARISAFSELLKVTSSSLKTIVTEGASVRRPMHLTDFVFGVRSETPKIVGNYYRPMKPTQFRTDFQLDPDGSSLAFLRSGVSSPERPKIDRRIGVATPPNFKAAGTPVCF
jgi:hypothetical protein